MTSSASLRALLPYVANIARNPVRFRLEQADGLIALATTCRVCTTPTDGWEICFQCNRQRRQFNDELADMVVPLSYGIKGHASMGQYYADLQNYKNGSSPAAARSRLKAMSVFYEELHRRCAEAVLGRIDSVLTVPSGRGRPRPHPLELLSSTIKPSAPSVYVWYTGPVRSARSATITPEHFQIESELLGHVQIVEDAWVQGINAQSLAIAAKRAGAARVSIVVYGRVLDANWGRSAGWIEQNLTGAKWNPDVCPVTGGACP